MLCNIHIALAIRLFVDWCNANPVENVNHFTKAIKKADSEIIQYFPLKGRSSHSIFYSYKNALLKKMDVKQSDYIYIIENYDISSGVIYGAAWCNTDSLNYIYNNGRLSYKNSSSFSVSRKKIAYSWNGDSCPQLYQEKTIHQQNFIVQKYGHNGIYKVCNYVF